MPEVVTFPSVLTQSSAVRPAKDFIRCDGSTSSVPSETYGGDVPSVTKSYIPVEEHSWRSPRDNDNFERRKRAGEIVMAPYEVGKLTTRRYLVQKEHRFKKWWAWYDHTGPTGECCESFLWSGTHGYTSQHSTEIAADLPTVGKLETGTRDDIADAVALTQNEAYARSHSGLDLTTELAEIGKTYQLGVDLIGAAASALETVTKRVDRIKTPSVWKGLSSRKLLRSSDLLLRRAGGIWLGAIYGILPVTYLIKDAFALKNGRHQSYHTYRSTRNINRASGGYGGSLPDTYLRYDANGSVTVRSTVKVRYSAGSPQFLADQISVNAFRTIWELIPFSFVADWFLNVGDLITSQTSMDMSTERRGCTSVKQVVNDSVSLVDFTSDISTRDYNPVTPCPVQTNDTYTFQRAVDALLSSVGGQTYSRTLFSRPSPKVVFEGNSYWRNIISSIALGYRPISNLLRKLR